jgi:hypothetical protein
MYKYFHPICEITHFNFCNQTNLFVMNDWKYVQFQRLEADLLVKSKDAIVECNTFSSL